MAPPLPIILLLLATATLSASDWPQWRGPTGMGQSDERGLPTSWGGAQHEHVLWTAALPKSDVSQSSPIVWGDKVFVTTALNKPVEHHVCCFDTATGRQLWDTSVPPGPWLLNDLRGGYACATPATDGKRVYALFGSALLVALDFSGAMVWRQDIEPRAFDVAIASSPLVFKDTVILLCDQNGKSSFLAAFDAATGASRWRQQRPGAGFNHSTPLLTSVAGRTQLLVSASNALQGVDPADGTLLWWFPSKGDVSTPVYAAGLAYTDEGRGGPGVCIDPSGSGELPPSHLKWTLKSGINGMNSPLVVGDYLYRISSTLRCYRFATGEEVWSHRLSGDFNPSPVATADGLIYYASSGMSWVIKAGPAFEQVAMNDLGEPSSCSPAVAGGRIFLKSDAHLFCIGAK